MEKQRTDLEGFCLGKDRPIEEVRIKTDTPSVGRVVHYVAYGTPNGEFPAGVCRAAVITEVVDASSSLGRVGLPDVVADLAKKGLVGLCVLNPTGQYFNRGILYDEAKAPGTWHWCERV